MGKNYEKFWLLRDLDVWLRRDVDTYAFESSSKLNSMGTRLFISRNLIAVTNTKTLYYSSYNNFCHWLDDGDHAPFLGGRMSVVPYTVGIFGKRKTQTHMQHDFRFSLSFFFSRCSDEDESQVGKSFSHICKTEEPNIHTPRWHTQRRFYMRKL